MSITENDKNNYFAGFLMLIRIEGTITGSSKIFVDKVANILDNYNLDISESFEIQKHVEKVYS